MLFARDGYVSTSVSTGNEAVSGVEDSSSGWSTIPTPT